VADLTAAPVQPIPCRRPWLSAPRLVLVVSAVASARLGLRPISDNSTLVHLRTGLEILRTGHVPHHDPYSFTAPGHPWVVQSWLASVLYALADRIGHPALVLEQGVLYGAVGVVIALAARSSTAPRWGLAAGLAVAASAPGWSPRPLMFGLLCLGLTMVISERNAHPLWLVPVVWVWVNTHGSFPLGLVWLGAYAVGDAVDRRAWPRAAAVRVGAFGVGLVVALANPVGPRLLTFPLIALHKRAVFQGIVEWHSPNFQDPNSLIALVFICGSLLVLLRRQLPWAQVLPVCGFVALALIAARNLGPLGVALAPALGAALASRPEVGATGDDPQQARHPALVWLDRLGRHRWWRAGVAMGACAALAAFVVPVLRGSGLDLSSYPVAALTEAGREGRLGPTHRIAAADVVGCYIVWRAGPATKVFIDDRYDMYPAPVVHDAAAIAAARDDLTGVLEQWRVDTVVWSAAQAVPQQLLTLGGWRQAWRDPSWVLLVRDDAAGPS